MIRTIIDAYNLIFQCGLQPKTLDSPLALHRARQRLIDELADRIEPAQRKEVKLVFDAKNPRGHSTPELVRKDFLVAFAREYEDADTMLIELMQRHSQPKQLTVVSSDHRVQTAASRRNAKPIDADLWFDRLGSRSPSASLSPSESDNSKQQMGLSEAETQQLLEQFSDLDLDDLDVIHGKASQGPTSNGPSSKSPSTAPPPSSSEDKLDEAAYNPFPPGYGEDLLP